MMKNMKKNDGYIMVYVLVVVLVVSMVAVAACTAAIRNFKSQSAAMNYTQDKYAAQGVVERIVAELKDAAVEVAEIIAAKENSDGSLYHYTDTDLLKDDLSAAVKAKLGDSDPSEINGIIDNVISTGARVEFKATMDDYKELTSDNLSQTVQSPEHGYYLMEAKLSTHVGSSKIDAEFEMRFNVKTDEIYSNVNGELKTITCYHINGVTFNFTSYEVTPTTGR